MRWKKGMLIYNKNAGNDKLERNLGGCLPVLAPHIDEFSFYKQSKKAMHAVIVWNMVKKWM